MKTTFHTLTGSLMIKQYLSISVGIEDLGGLNCSVSLRDMDIRHKKCFCVGLWVYESNFGLVLGWCHHGLRLGFGLGLV